MKMTKKQALKALHPSLKNKITLTNFELVLLKRAISEAEMKWNNEGRTIEAENLKDLHINIDEQVS